MGLKDLNISTNFQLGNGAAALICENLKQLINLEMMNIGLTEMPDVSGLNSLKELGISSNKLTKLHDSVGTLASLEKLACSLNKIAEIPNVSKLQSLTAWILAGTRASPSWMGQSAPWAP